MENTQFNMANDLKKTNTGFNQIFIGRYFRLISERRATEIETDIFGWQNRGFDMDHFFWMNHTLEMNREELIEILSDEEYKLNKNQIEYYCSIYFHSSDR